MIIHKEDMSTEAVYFVCTFQGTKGLILQTRWIHGVRIISGASVIPYNILSKKMIETLH